jgi:hypothetical protein
MRINRFLGCGAVVALIHRDDRAPAMNFEILNLNAVIAADTYLIK